MLRKVWGWVVVVDDDDDVEGGKLFAEGVVMALEVGFCVDAEAEGEAFPCVADWRVCA